MFISSRSRLRRALAVMLLGMIALANVRPGHAQDRGDAPAPDESAKLGVVVNDAAACAGYTLIFPLQSTKTYLVDMDGRVVRTWHSAYRSGQDAYLMPNGNLLRSAHVSDDEAYFAGASQGGRIQEFTWDGELVWDYKFHDENHFRHHAITPMPNGNIMMIVWERKTAAECVEAGVDPEAAGDGDILVDSLYEVKPNGKTDGDIVWEWHIWDHLIQDHDKTKANFGDVAAHPELIDANYARSRGGFFGNFARGFRGDRDRDRGRDNDRRGDDDRRADNARRREDRDGDDDENTDEAVRRLQGIGYVGAAPRRGEGRGRPIPDWTHANGVSYNAELDQVMLSPREFNEVWIIDHSTTTEHARGHTGGRSGKGGDLLYRWGNPRAYRAGTEADQRLFSQHDTHWIPVGLPGAGHMLVFNNGGGRPDGGYSSVDEVVLPVDSEGDYTLEPGKAFGPTEATWSYGHAESERFHAMLMSGAQRLPNGNTLVCTGFNGEVFEVTPDRKMVWKFLVPNDSEGSGFGPPGRGGPPRGGFGGPPPGFGPPGENAGSVSLLPGPTRFFLELERDQMERVEGFEKEASATLDKTLTAEQREQLKKFKEEQASRGPGGEGKVGEVVSAEARKILKLNDDQTAVVDQLQTSATELMAAVLNDEQRERIKGFEEMASAFANGGPPDGGPPGDGPNFGAPGPGRRGGPPDGGPNFGPPGRGRGGPGRGGFGGPGGFPGFGGVPGTAAIFRSYRYPNDYAGLAGKNLAPGKLMTEVVKEAQPPANDEGPGANR